MATTTRSVGVCLFPTSSPFTTFSRVLPLPLPSPLTRSPPGPPYRPRVGQRGPRAPAATVEHPRGVQRHRTGLGSSHRLGTREPPPLEGATAGAAPAPPARPRGAAGLRLRCPPRRPRLPPPRKPGAPSAAVRLPARRALPPFVATTPAHRALRSAPVRRAPAPSKPPRTGPGPAAPRRAPGPARSFARRTGIRRPVHPLPSHRALPAALLATPRPASPPRCTGPTYLLSPLHRGLPVALSRCTGPAPRSPGPAAAAPRTYRRRAPGAQRAARCLPRPCPPLSPLAWRGGRARRARCPSRCRSRSGLDPASAPPHGAPALASPMEPAAPHRPPPPRPADGRARRTAPKSRATEAARRRAPAVMVRVAARTNAGGKGLWRCQCASAEQPARQHPQRRGHRLASRMAWRSLVLVPFLLTAVSGNTAPFFNMTVVYVPEDLELGQYAFQLKATDLDGDKLTYSISETFYFSVNGQTGNVTLKNYLDYETLPRFTIVVSVSDEVNEPVFRNLTVIVEDRNDNAPVFQGLPYQASIPENMTLNSVVFTVFANDSDTGDASKVSYSIKEVIPDSMNNRWLFYILPNGKVVLNGSLDYARNTFYQLKIFAKDGGGLLHNELVFQESWTYLSLTIRDLPNLDPRFLNEPYSGSVPENCDLGTTVLTVTAMDRDTGVNDEISYSITNTSIPFAIDPKMGTITVREPLDREQLPSEEVLLEVKAREKDLDIHGKVAQASTLVTVLVTDVNDNKPQFYHCSLPSCNFSTSAQNSFRGSIIEHSSSRLPVSNLSIVAHDPDKGINSSYELHLQGPNASAFTVSPPKIVGTGEVQLLVQNPAAVDYEISHVMMVQIIANDTGNPTDCCSTAAVTIDLIDSNDHIPEFPQSTYNLSVMENCPDGTIIAPNITADDPDSGVLGEITYQLLPETICTIFTVNATTGTVLVQNGSLLDRETRSIYYANLQAKDGGNLVGTTVLEITVLDANDMAPIITGSYFISVEEGQNISTQIQAIDNDEPGSPNSKLGFRILPGPFSENFTINEATGEMHSKEPLDREALEDKQGRMVVTVLVYDHGVPQLNTSANVTITVGDLNDNAPVFLNQSYEFSVFEDSPGSFVGQVQATDADRTEINYRISFLLQRGSGSSNFLIRSSQLGLGHYGGQLSVDPDTSLDYDTMQQKFFSLVVQAENTAADIGDTANVSVVVHILDVNDEPPTVLLPSPDNIHVSENNTQQGLVLTLVASDPDTNHSLVFEELGAACFKGAISAGEVCWDWFVLAPNGSVLVNSSDIDYELCDVVELTLRAEDLYTEKGNRYSQNETLRILITDVNDNAPLFLPISETFVVVPEVSPVGLQVATVKATDADSGLAGTIVFSVVSVVLVEDNGVSQLLENLFKVDTMKEADNYIGTIRVASNLDSSLKGQYQLTVEAQDGSLPVHTAQTVLNIFAVDQSYRVHLQFVETVDKVQANSEHIKAALTTATKAGVYVAAIRSTEDTRASQVEAKSVMEAYFVYSNGTALDVNQLSVLIQSDPQILAELVNLGLAVIGPGEVVKPTKETELIGIIAGLAAFLLIFILIMTLVLVLTTRSYKRKLSAMKALKAATTFSPAMAQQGAGIPGTNQYNAEGANPMLNLSIDPSHDLGFHEDSISVASMNSLDENTVNAPGDNNPGDKQGQAQLMDPSDKEVLVAALNGKEPTKMAYINTTFTTTDL